ncbi:hypothetical protein GCM10011374_01140 [Kocuria dechangensis]|uniref:Agd3 CBM87 domain-containing protein n=1 Tax=Kocuria dechangensis TaxID=1176249 RepID=A0A917GEU8_9MICC|nr:hypothetical protein [Kocuria dechangensis]GGG42542.1 hypothetical protein GCM10011374_01140 [Kocuria dechangensis]
MNHSILSSAGSTAHRSPAESRKWVRVTALAAALLLAGPVAQTMTAPADAAVAKAVNPKIDLRVLVVSDGSEMITAYQDRLTREGIPFQVLDLRQSGRPAVNDAYLTTVDAEAPHARFQGVIMPNSAPAGMTPAELTALHEYQARFGVRQISAYVYPGAQHGMNAPTYSGKVDGLSATVTAAAKTKENGHGYLKGTVKLDNIDPNVDESYGYLGTPASTPGVTVTPLVTATAPGTSTQGVLSGVFNDGSREELFNTYASNQYQQHFQVLSHGQIEWLTRGVRLGEYANWFSVHSDDVLMADALWNTGGNCTYGDDCDETVYPSDAPGTTARMVPSDVTYQRNWEQNWAFKIDNTYNGAGTAQYLEEKNTTSDPLLNAYKQNASAFRWINHTYTHLNLGCEKVYGSLGTWTCATNPDGSPKWVSQAAITDEIATNKTFGNTHGLKYEPNALVTGEHSGLKALPQVTTDNPNLAPALSATAVKWTASDASREKEQRAVGSALTVPRYPMNIYYNTATRVQAVDEYNWIYTSRANGGSGICEDNPGTTTCITPLSTTTGFQNYIVPIETRIALSHVVGNDPRPHFVHQSNQTQDRIIYPVLQNILTQYRNTFAASTPVLNPTMTQAGSELLEQSTWRNEQDATAFYWKGQVRVAATGNGASVPVSLPDGATKNGAALPATYAGKDTDRVTVPAGGSVTYSVGTLGWGATSATTVAAPNTFSGTSVPTGPATTEIAPEPVVAPEEAAVAAG